jgi:hypothetical protein
MVHVTHHGTRTSDIRIYAAYAYSGLHKFGTRSMVQEVKMYTQTKTYNLIDDPMEERTIEESHIDR